MDTSGTRKSENRVVTSRDRRLCGSVCGYEMTLPYECGRFNCQFVFNIVPAGKIWSFFGYWIRIWGFIRNFRGTTLKQIQVSKTLSVITIQIIKKRMSIDFLQLVIIDSFVSTNHCCSSSVWWKLGRTFNALVVGNVIAYALSFLNRATKKNKRVSHFYIFFHRCVTKF